MHNIENKVGINKTAGVSLISVIFVIVIFILYTHFVNGPALSSVPFKGEKMKLTSPDFVNRGDIPPKFTCQGSDLIPELVIEEVPDGTKSLALIVDDPDAPMGTWVHWVVFDMPPSTDRIAQGAVPGKQGRNDFGKLDYGGPCPPSGKHRYFFKVYALDTVIGEKEGISKKDLVKLMGGHILAQAELAGLYEKVR